MSFLIKIADVVIGIKGAKKGVKRFCKDYIVFSQNPDFTISIWKERILAWKKRERSVAAGVEAEKQMIYRKIANHMLEYDGFLMHAAVIKKDGLGYAFLAPSGTGKSTHIQQWMQVFPGEVDIINGDKPIVRKIESQFFAFGTPWAGKEQLQMNDNAPLKALCFLEQAKDNSIRELDKNEAIERLMRQLLMPEDPLNLTGFFKIVEELVLNTNCYLLKCNISSDAAIVAHAAMNTHL